MLLGEVLDIVDIMPDDLRGELDETDDIITEGTCQAKIRLNRLETELRMLHTEGDEVFQAIEDLLKEMRR